MQKLGRLYIAFCEIAKREKKDLTTVEEMFDRRNFPILSSALSRVADEENHGDVKSSLKLAIRFLIKKTVKFLTSKYLIEDGTLKLLNWLSFAQLLKMNWSLVFEAAECKATTDLQIRLQKPARSTLANQESSVSITTQWVKLTELTKTYQHEEKQ